MWEHNGLADVWSIGLLLTQAMQKQAATCSWCYDTGSEVEGNHALSDSD
jgi:hypothetical protein